MTEARRHPEREQSFISEDAQGRRMFVCGIAVEPDEEPVSLRSRHHPGFGVVQLQRNGRAVECCARWEAHVIGRGDFEKQPTLQHYENRAARNPRARWTLEVHGPMTGYVLGRRRGRWYVIESLDGFA